MPIAGNRSTEQVEAATSTTVVSREPAAPSMRSWDALRSAAVQAGAEEIPVAAGVATAVGPADSVGAALGGAVGIKVAGATDGASEGAAEGVAEQATRPRASRPATSEAAARVRADPRRSAMPREGYRGSARSAPDAR